ncbi:MAG: preprotein translocase subunit SecG [Bacteroidetes bacterium]|uniref:Protein-export membrane protein SecG n=1 Tax=Candidatus Cryptobacteroides faecipullorum TaxID=2840764 RepID=A0A9D9I7S1_9BACT|nr:preprotein translocase subunit SecG [Candidatus Cryptobacteroides faecipullorum]
MNVLFTILTVLVIIASVLVTIVVLLQNSKGGGLASNFVAGNQTFGVRKTADILEKITWGLVAFIFVFSIATTFTTTGSGKNEVDITDKVENAASDQVPEFPSAPLQQSAPAQEAPAAETPAE